ncbi:MAG: MBL fold metallo-hydrolase [Candidatus Omnitrophota bacterium]
MYVKVIFDQKAKKGLLSGTGFSCLIDGKILFDTAEASTALVENMDRFMVSALDLKAVVISHDYWNHTGGLWELLRRQNGLKVYGCKSFSHTFIDCVKELGGDLVLLDKPVEIEKNIFATGELINEETENPVSEQAIVVHGDKGTSVITGCAHSGILNLVRGIKDTFRLKDLYMVLGGFNLDPLDMDEIRKITSALVEMGVKKTGPAYSSGDKARRIFSGKYHENYIPVEAGYIIQL